MRALRAIVPLLAPILVVIAAPSSRGQELTNGLPPPPLPSWLKVIEDPFGLPLANEAPPCDDPFVCKPVTANGARGLIGVLDGEKPGEVAPPPPPDPKMVEVRSLEHLVRLLAADGDYADVAAVRSQIAALLAPPPPPPPPKPPAPPPAPVQASGSFPGGSPTALPPSLRAIMLRALQAKGLPASWADSSSLAEVLWHESRFDSTAQNPSSTAHGLFQMLTCTTNDAYTQCVDGLKYIEGRYGTPDGAWEFWQAHSWY